MAAKKRNRRKRSGDGNLPEHQGVRVVGTFFCSAIVNLVFPRRLSQAAI
jgi:hypothetical protein